MIKLVVFTLSSALAFACSCMNLQKSGTSTLSSPTGDTVINFLDTAYRDVIMIEDHHVAHEGNNYLIDIPLKEHQDTLHVFFLSARVPVDLFKNSASFFPDVKEFILIVPDWEFYQRVAEDATKNGIVLEPATTNVYYHIKRVEDQILVDSMRISGNDHPQLDFTNPKVPKDHFVSYRSEQYGSVCCPKDPRWEIIEEDGPFIKDFENRNNVRIKGIYRQNNGKEGEHITYYTLPGLSPEQRLKFIVEKRSQWIVNKTTKTTDFAPQVFTPQVVPFVKTGFNKTTPVTF
ncbi:hypothetical protein U0038_10750 [Sphingobacterium spiritivorum]|nr:hypothetical protein [Sphingobacterium spiritivorum]WQD36227.1 hypothetical protein U0038_10750 [Sphingobacterium spiritivorum]SUJ04937.1 Uncharacterised protein [Sphingobacterium spiritivorum]